MFQILKTYKNDTPNNIWDIIFKNENKTAKYIIKYSTKENKYFDNIVKQNEKMTEILNEKMKDYLSHNNPSEQYKTFKIPKKSGGYRELNEPCPELKQLQRELQNFLVTNLKVYATPWAYAYENKKSIIDMAKKHQNSNYFLKLDIHHFFNNIDQQILKENLPKLYQLAKLPKEFINNLIKIATKNDELPQGSPLSPLLSNIIAIELDYKIKKNEKLKNLYYTRYADDLVFSSKSYISKTIVVYEVQDILQQLYDNKLLLNCDKTKFLTKNQRCYIVGVKINKDNQLTFGHEKKKALKLQLYNLFKAKQNQDNVTEQAREVLGLFNFMSQIEPEYAEYLKAKLCRQFHISKEHFFSYLIN